MNESNSPRISLRDIAKKLGLSHSTVSLALRDHPRISPAVREKIHALAREMGYHPDPMLSALAHYRRDRTESPVRSAVAWINNWSQPEELRRHKEFEFYWKGAMNAAEKFGYYLEEFNVGPELPPKRLETILEARSIQGILLAPADRILVQSGWEEFDWKKFSIVRLGRSWKVIDAHIVGSDQVANTMLAFQKMREKGYNRIGFATGEGSVSWALFEAGYLLAQAEMEPGLRLPPLILSKTTSEEHATHLKAWMQKHKPDAILTDVAPLHGLLEQCGFRVPGDVGLAVESILDGNADAGINQHPEEIGRVAFLALMSHINDHSLGTPPIFRQSLISGHWVDGSTLPPR